MVFQLVATVTEWWQAQKSPFLLRREFGCANARGRLGGSYAQVTTLRARLATVMSM